MVMVSLFAKWLHCVLGVWTSATWCCHTAAFQCTTSFYSSARHHHSAACIVQFQLVNSQCFCPPFRS